MPKSENNNRSKYFYASRRRTLPHSSYNKSTSNKSDKCLCDMCNIMGCQFRGQYENLHKQKFHWRDVMCGYDVDMYIKGSLKDELP